MTAGTLTALKHDTPVTPSEGELVEELTNSALSPLSNEQGRSSPSQTVQLTDSDDTGCQGSAHVASPVLTATENQSFEREAMAAFVARSIAARRQVPNATIFFNGAGYCSVCEAVCATMLELYVPGFAIECGVTYQIDLGRGRTADFFINGIVLEFHGVRLDPRRQNFSFRSRGEFREFQRRVRRCGRNDERRAQVYSDTRCAIAADYYARRRQALDESEEFACAELVVVTSADEFYEQVIVRLNPRFAPVRHDFIDTFFSLAEMIGKQNVALQRQLRRRAA